MRDHRWAFFGRSLGLALAACGTVVYVLPLFAPPETAATSLDVSRRALLAERLFPGVAASWVLIRLAGLALAALGFLCMGWSTGAREARRVVAPVLPPAPDRGTGMLALACSLALAGVAIAAPWLSLWTEFVFLILLPAPVVVIALRERRGRVARSTYAGLALITFWAATRVWSGWADPRTATTVDTWPVILAFTDAMHEGRSSLYGRFEPGVPDLIHILLGGPILRALGWDVSHAWVRVATILWLSGGAIALQVLARRIAGGPASLVAVAAMLYAPFTLHDTIDAAPYGVVTALIIGLLLAFHSWIATGSAASLVALAVLGGLAAPFGHAAIPTAMLGLATAASMVWRFRQIPAVVVIVSVVALAGVLFPNLPRTEDLVEIRSFYFQRFLPWEHAEAYLLGQRYIMVDFELHAAGFPEFRVSALETVGAALLAPFAIARNGLRHCGDVLLEPIGAVFAVAGLVWTILARGHAYRWIPLFYAAIAIVPGFTTSYDRVSLVRLMNTVPTFALLSAVGFAALQSLWPQRRTVASLAATGVVVASGWILFERVNPRILPQSWMTIAMEAGAGASDPADAVFLDFPDASVQEWLFIDIVAAQAGSHPIPVRRIDESSLLRDASDGWRQWYWSPALEWEHHPSLAFCQAASDGNLFRLWDPPRLSHAWVGSRDVHWRPKFPAQRWELVSSCANASRGGTVPR